MNLRAQLESRMDRHAQREQRHTHVKPVTVADCRGGVGPQALRVGDGDAAEDLGDPDPLLGDVAGQPGHGSALPPRGVGEGEGQGRTASSSWLRVGAFIERVSILIRHFTIHDSKFRAFRGYRPFITLLRENKLQNVKLWCFLTPIMWLS